MEPSPRRKYGTDATEKKTTPSQKVIPIFFRSASAIVLIDVGIHVVERQEQENRGTRKARNQAMSNIELEAKRSEMGIYQDISFDENTKKVVGFRESHGGFET